MPREAPLAQSCGGGVASLPPTTTPNPLGTLNTPRRGSTKIYSTQVNSEWNSENGPSLDGLARALV